MPFDAFSAVQAFADGSDNRAISDVLAELNTQQLSDLRVQVEAQLNHMPEKGDPLRAQRLQQLRDLLRGSVRGMIVSLAASMAMEKATGYTPSAFETRAENANAPSTSTVKKETIVHPARPAISAFDKPTEQPAAKAPAAAAATEKPAVSFEDFKKMSDPKNEKNVVRNFFGYMSYRVARFIASSSAADGMLGKMFKKFGWDKGAATLTTLIELQAGTTKSDVKNPPAAETPAARGETPQEKASPTAKPAPSAAEGPSVPAPTIAQPEVTAPVPPKDSAPTTSVPESKPPAKPSVAIPPAAAPAPAPAPNVPPASPNLFDGSLEGKNLLDGTVFNVEGHTMSLPLDAKTFLTFDGKKYAAVILDIPMGGTPIRALLASSTMHKDELHITDANQTVYKIKKDAMASLAKEMAINNNKTVTLKIPVTMIAPNQAPKVTTQDLTLKLLD